VVEVRLDGFRDGGVTPELLSTTLGALTLLSDRKVVLYIELPGVPIRAKAVRQLGDTLGSSLKQLILSECSLPPSFWAAVWAHLPGLQYLTLTDELCGAVGADDLAFFCSRSSGGARIHPHCQPDRVELRVLASR
jgi:hypothetical protein